jgi:hypothetical protein
MQAIALFTWSVVRGDYGIYFSSKLPRPGGVRQPIQLHGLVHMMTKGVLVPGLVVDHKDRDTLNNRASNLRLLPQQLNTMNSERSLKGSSKYPGVSFHKVAKKFRAILTIDKKQKILGHYENEKEAAERVLETLMLVYPYLEWKLLAEEFFPGIKTHPDGD